jgi:uncharacterized protein YjcR
LTADYLAGVKVKVLAERYGITRQTVFDHIRRRGIPRRSPGLGPDEVDEARGLYESGKSLATIGGLLGVNAETVRLTLTKAGVSMRDQHGRNRPC